MSTTAKELIIHRPDLQRRRSRVLSSTLTLVAWIAWGYLWLPLVTLVAWYLGYRAFTREILIPDTRTILLTLAVYAVVVVVIGASLILWSRYNVRRFRGKERRAGADPLTDAELTERFGIDEETLTRMRDETSMRVHLAADGRILDVAVTTVTGGVISGSHEPVAVPAPGQPLAE